MTFNLKLCVFFSLIFKLRNKVFFSVFYFGTRKGAKKV